MDAQTNPKAKTITMIRYVHRKRISEQILGERRRNSGRKTLSIGTDMVADAVQELKILLEIGTERMLRTAVLISPRNNSMP